MLANIETTGFFILKPVLKQAGELKRVWVDGAGSLALNVGRLGGFRAQVAPDGVAGDAEPLDDLPQRDLVTKVGHPLALDSQECERNTRGFPR